jgi:hypothetical protein
MIRFPERALRSVRVIFPCNTFIQKEKKTGMLEGDDEVSGKMLSEDMCQNLDFIVECFQYFRERLQLKRGTTEI